MNKVDGGVAEGVRWNNGGAFDKFVRVSFRGELLGGNNGMDIK